MKRWVIRICVFLLLGAIVNVAVAWGFATYMPFEWNLEKLREESNVALWRSISKAGWPRQPESSFVLETPNGSEVWSFGTALSETHTCYMMVIRNGWPALALQRVLRTDWFGEGHWYDSEWAVLEVTFPRSSDLPLQPAWPGFAINMVFYGAILWLLFAALIAIRRRRRAKRGLCPACAYPVGTSAVCTECGRNIATSRQVNKST